MSSRLRRRCVVLALCVAGPVLLAVACLGPTEMTVTVVTDVPCEPGSFAGVTITVGDLDAIEAAPATSRKDTCVGPGKVGSVVIKRGGGSGVAMKVVMGVGQHSVDLCTADSGYTGGCIVARRQLGFLDHENLHVTVALNTSCIDFPCAPNKTCRNHTCVDPGIDPHRCESPDGCGEEALDGGAADDGGLQPDGAFDAGPVIASVLAAGSGHTCLLTSAGGVKCWGDDVVGELGDNGTGQPSPTPRDVLVNPATPLTGAASLSSGADTVCVVTTSGRTKCWGVGLDHADDGGTPFTYTMAADWPAVAGATEVAFGYRFVCWRTGNAQVQCMGRNDSGELGNGTKTYGFPAVSSALKNSAPLAQLAGGLHFSCALTAGGQVACVGDNSENQIDPSGASGVDLLAPFTIPSLPAMAEIRTGSDHVCGRVAVDGTVLCWGDDQYSVLGYPSDAGAVNGTHTVKVVGGAPLAGTKRLASGDFFTCAITSSGNVACWGKNDRGQLGRGPPATVGSESDVAADVSGAANIVALTAGVDHACAQDVAGHVFCWGRNDRGQCGQPTTMATVTTAMQVSGL